ncbi:MAG TPA: sigma-70 family RNA polymerase sigma factor [Sedimentisphaerales bacterium]|nr:sigma-70 family RNA polymerase sigma factor [Sedimentisphaerales bacterium]
MADELNQQRWAEIAKGAADTWRQFVRQQIPRLYGMFMKSWPNPSLAEELVQRTVFDAVRGRACYDPSKGRPEQWICGIARNVIRLEIRKRAARPRVNGDLSRYVETIDAEPLPDEILEQEETAAIVRAALNKLETRQQKVLKARYIEDLPASEIARQMNITEKAVHSLLYRARISLREELGTTAPPER